MANPVRPFEAPEKFVDPDTGGLTRRAEAFLRDWFLFTGAGSGTVPVNSIGGNGVSTTTFLREDGSFAVPNYPVGAAPTASLGLSAIPGTAATFMRSDAAPELSEAISPIWTALHVFSFGIQGTTINFSSSITGNSLIAVTGFGCNGKTAQTSVSVNTAITDTAGGTYTAAEQTMLANVKALLNQIRAALVSNGILV